MNKLKLACLAPFFIGGVAFAGPSCNGFQIKLKNNLADSLVVTSVKLNGADIQPGSFENLNSGAEQAFTINNSNENTPMTGEFTLRTASLPVKTVKIAYTLENKTGVCDHTDIPQSGNDYAAVKSRELGAVKYDISNQ